MENREYLNSLFDIYKELVTMKEQQAFSEHYIEDLSMQEIADNLNVSKSNIGMIVKRAEQKLIDYETKLHILEKNNKIKEALLKKEYKLIEKIIDN